MTTTVSATMLGTVNPSGSDDTAAIQAAINTGRDVLFCPGTYYAANLTQSTQFQRFIAMGDVKIIKNANGPIITVSGNDVEFNGIGFRGDAASPTFTGDNVVASGSNLRMVNCGSRWAAGRALKATGNHVQVMGTCDIYQTADATATGYDIEIGVSGTATLYHQLVGVYSSQATGGIKLVDTGSHTILGGQFGKLFVDAGTSPGGVNGGMTMGARILGAVTVELSSAVFAGCQFGSVAVVFQTGTSGCRFDSSNSLSAGATVVNNGNANNFIMREVSTGGTIDIKFGQDSSTIVLKFDPSTGALALPYDVTVPNNTGALRLNNLAGSGNAYLNMSAANNLGIVNTFGAMQFQSNGGVYQLISLPTSSAGLPSGALWRDSGAGNVIKMVP